jgi:hypothetical protein
MNWPVVAVASYLALGLEVALSPVLALGRPDGSVVPGFVLPLVVFIAMHAAPLHALWYALAMGAAMDLLGPIGSSRGPGTLVGLGTMATAYLAAIAVVLQVRTSVVRRNPLSLGALTIVAGVIAAIVSVSIVSFRSLYSEPAGYSLAGELLRRTLGTFYTAIPATLLAFPLNRWLRYFGFQDPGARRFARRG